MEAFKYSMVVSLQEVLDSIDCDEVETAYWSEDEDEDEELDEIFRDIYSFATAMDREQIEREQIDRQQIYDIKSKELAELHAVLDAEFEAVLVKHLAKKEMQRQKVLEENK